MGLGIKTKYRQMVEATLGARTQRLGALAKNEITGRIAGINPDEKPADPQVFTTIVGEANIGELVVSLLSLHQSSERLPEILVHTDLKTRPEQVRQALAWWPGRLTVRPAAEVLDLARDIHPGLVAFAHAHRHGLKFCACLTAALNEAVIYSDSDVLWFQDWSKLLNSPTTDTGAYLKMSLDLGRRYSDELEEFWAAFAKQAPLNSGIMLLRGNLFDACDLGEAVQTATRNPDQFFAEQTLFAIGCRRLGGLQWPAETVHLSSRGYFLAARHSHPASAVLRHYPGRIRALFWLDALDLVQRAVGTNAAHGGPIHLP